METKLSVYQDEEDAMVHMITEFSVAKGYYAPDWQTAVEDLREWTKRSNSLYLIRLEGKAVGFVRLVLGRRGAGCHADVFILPEYQTEDADAQAVALAEEKVKAHFDSLYAGEDPEGNRLIRSYHEIAYTCENAVAAGKTFRLGKQ